MTLTSGQRLGPYEVVELIGKGGMGEVYKARDPRLNRIVAIKTSTEQFSARFEQEARAVAALNHANICTIHDVGPNYLVLEYIEGTPLQGPLPLVQVFRYGMQICDALNAAHRKGITHRDLKPGNILVTKAGIKLLDFGLARIDSPRTPTGETATIPSTDPGTVMGTFQYMSPEQLEGNEADVRSDIFALGAVLFEMATGRKAFQGKSQASLISAIMSGEPQSMTELVPITPPALERIVQTCLAKDPDERWQSARDVKHALRGALEQEGVPVPVASRRFWPYVVALTAFAILAAALAVVHFREVPSQPETYQFEIDRPQGSGEPAVAISPDGRRLVTFTGREGLRVRDLDSLDWRSLEGTSGARYPFWSNDGADIGFFAQGELKRIPVAGGIPRTLAKISDGRGGTWNSAGDILYAPSPTGALWRVRAEGGTAPVQVTQVVEGDLGDRFPQFLPDGQHFLFSRGATGKPDAAGLFMGSLDGKPPVRVMAQETNAMFLPTPGSNTMGRLIFQQEGTLMAQRFDYASVKLFDGPVPIQQGVATSNTNAAVFSVSRNGNLALIQSRARAAELVWVDRKGNVGETLARFDFSADTGGNLLARSVLSSDMKRLALNLGPATNVDVWIRNLATQASYPLTKDFGASSPLWSPDDKDVIFYAMNTDRRGLYRKASDGTGKEELLVKTSVNARPWDMSRDGKLLIYSQQGPTTGIDLWVLPMQPGPDGTRKPEIFLQSPAREDAAKFAPSADGAPHFMAYTTNGEIWVQRVPRTEEKWRVAEGGPPRWSDDGKELLFISQQGGKNVLMHVAVRLGTGFEGGRPEVLFELPARLEFNLFPAPDGKRFLFAARPEGDFRALSITVITNWGAKSKD